MAQNFGVDISSWQKGVNYHEAVKTGKVEFAMLRAGFGKNVKTGKDNMFDEHYEGFVRENIPVGAYQYSYATSPADAVREAEVMLEWVKDKPLDLPLFLDMEEASVAALGRETCTMIARTWMQTIIGAGYECGVYANPNWFENYLDPDAIAELGFIWCASWGTTKPTYSNMLMWQYGGEVNKLKDRAVPGIGEVVDQNYFYGDLPDVTPKESAYMYVTCTKRTPTLNRSGKKELNRWIDPGDVCAIKLVEGALVEVIYPTPSGLRTAYLKDITNFMTE